MSAPPSMRTRRSRPPGFAAVHTDQTSRGVVAREPSAPPASDTDSAAGENGRVQTSHRPAVSPSPQPATNRSPTGPPAPSEPPASDEGAYAGAATRQFNTRLLEPLHRRYM